MKIQDFIETNSNLSYRDIQASRFYEEYQPTRENDTFLASLRKYEKLDKIEVSTLSERISALQELNETLLNSNIYLSGIKQGIVKKQEHLIALQHLFNLGILRNRKELYNPEVEELFGVNDKSLLSLKNDIVYDFGTNVLLGKYILEAIDPAHRFTVIKYIDQWQQTTKNVPFFMYLEQYCIYDLIPQIKYFSDRELKALKIHIQNGLLYQADGQLLTTDKNKEYLFILGKNNQFYGCYSQKGVKHTSLSRGDAIKCGGSLGVENGKVLWINLDSGHYFPSLAHLNKLVYYMKQCGVQLNDDIPINYHENYIRKSISLKKGLER